MCGGFLDQSENMCLHIVSRQVAKEVGLKRFFLGKPCKRGHLTERSFTGGCVGCSRERSRRKDRREYKKEHYRANRERYFNLGKIWMEENKESYNESRRKRYANDTDYRLSRLMQGNVQRVFAHSEDSKGGRKSRELLGYGAEELRVHLESLFTDGMTWENYGNYGWHVEHKTPIICFIRDGIKDPAIIHSLDNLIPMWASHNSSKSDKTLEEWLSEKGQDSQEWRLYSKYLNNTNEGDLQ